MRSKQRRTYTKEFKLEAVRLTQEPDRTAVEVAENLGINVKELYRWKQQYAEQAQASFPGSGKRAPRDEEIWQLKKKLARAEQERDILKKALAYFASEPR